jgi:hypothetical protein
LSSAIHREEHRIFRGIGVHASGPLAQMFGMAATASEGIEQFLAREMIRSTRSEHQQHAAAQ